MACKGGTALSKSNVVIFAGSGFPLLRFSPTVSRVLGSDDVISHEPFFGLSHKQ